MYELEGNVGFSRLAYTPKGKPVLDFTVAQSNDWYDRETKEWTKKDPTWFKFALWGDEAERGAEWIDVGARVVVQFKKILLDNWKSGDRSGTSLLGNSIVRVLPVPKKNAEAAEAAAVDPADEIN